MISLFSTKGAILKGFFARTFVWRQNSPHELPEWMPLYITSRLFHRILRSLTNQLPDQRIVFTASACINLKGFLTPEMYSQNNKLPKPCPQLTQIFLRLEHLFPIENAAQISIKFNAVQMHINTANANPAVCHVHNRCGYFLQSVPSSTVYRKSCGSGLWKFLQNNSLVRQLPKWAKHPKFCKWDIKRHANLTTLLDSFISILA